MNNNDPFGNACLEFLDGHRNEVINVFCNVTSLDTLPVDYLFRAFDEMPKLEQKALEVCKGKVLVVGAGAGCHSLWLKENGLEVYSIDVSQGAVKTMKQYGLSNVYLQDLFTFQTEEKFDTVLILMNGIGIAGTLDRLPMFIKKCTSFLSEKGQLIADSTDLERLILDEVLSYSKNRNNYIGEVSYQMTYKSSESEWFDWLYVDQFLLEKTVKNLGAQMEVLLVDEGFNYLVRIQE